MRDRVFIVADDLTGALDSAATFAMRGASVRVACRPDDLPAALGSDAGVVAVATGTRDGSEAHARSVATRVAAMLADHSGILFKKIDSRLKGHIATELEALTSAGTTLLVNPAIPRLGRICVGGAVTGAGVETPIPVAPRVGQPVTLPDTHTAEDLARQLPERLDGVVSVGAAGLAEALADRLWPEALPHQLPRPERPALLAIGSRDPVTAAQIATLQGVPVTDAPNGIAPDLTNHPLQLIRMSPGAEEIPGAEAGAQFADTLARAHAQLKPRTLFACGGESAAALLARLGSGQLDLLGEILPGVPIARTTGAEKLTLITKSGGFGPPDTLVKLVNFLAND